MKRRIAALIAALIALCAFGAAVAEAGIANPWTDSDAAQVEAAVGVAFGVPEGAENVAYRLLAADSLAEMDFTWYGMDYCARIQPAADFTDISGLYMDRWDQTMDVAIGPWTAVEHRGAMDGVIWNLIQWYDADAGRMYSVLTSGEDLDGFDIAAAAEAIYAPATASEQAFIGGD